MAYSIINVSGKKPKTYDALTRLQDYIEQQKRRERTSEATPPAWHAARDELRASLTPENYASLIAPIQARQEGDRLIIGSPDEFSRYWMEHRLDWQVRRALDGTGNGHLQVAYEVRSPAAPADPTDPTAPRILMSRDDWATYTRDRLDQLGLTPRQGKESDRYNSPLAIHYTASTSAAWGKDHPELVEPWRTHTAAFFTDLHGAANVLGIVAHEDQKTLHMHLVGIPIDARGRLCASSFTRTPAHLEVLHTQYNRYLRDHGLALERGQNYRLERSMAAASPDVRQMALHADGIPLGEVLERLEADRDGRDARRWTLGDRIIQVHDDGHSFTELGPHGASEGHGALDLVIRLRQEGHTPLEEHGLAVGYLAAVHPERIPGGAPPLVPAAPEPLAHQPLERQSMRFGQQNRWEPGQFLIVDSLPDAVKAMGASKGWGRVAVAENPEALPVDELDEAIAKGWMVDVATKSDALWNAVQERYADHTEEGGRQVWRSPAPSTAKAKAAEKAMEMDKGPDIGPEMMMGL